MMKTDEDRGRRSGIRESSVLRMCLLLIIENCHPNTVLSLSDAHPGK
jgi:hypothetical protein